MENILGNYPGARQVFERWMSWHPGKQAWLVYIRFEIRCGEIERARKLYERMVEAHNTVKAWLSWAKFEEKQGNRFLFRLLSIFAPHSVFF